MLNYLFLWWYFFLYQVRACIILQTMLVMTIYAGQHLLSTWHLGYPCPSLRGDSVSWLSDDILNKMVIPIPIFIPLKLGRHIDLSFYKLQLIFSIFWKFSRFPLPVSVALSSALFTIAHHSPGKSIEIFIFGENILISIFDNFLLV